MNTKRVEVELIGGPFDGAVRQVVVNACFNSLRYLVPDWRDPQLAHAYGGEIADGRSRIEYLGPEKSEATHA